MVSPSTQPVDRTLRRCAHSLAITRAFPLYRGESGKARVMANECAHRLSVLSTGWVEGETIRCRYHGWRYDASGQCVEQPAEPKPFCDSVRRLASYPTQDAPG